MGNHRSHAGAGMTNWIIAYLALNLAVYFGLSRDQREHLCRSIVNRLLGRS